MGFIPLWFRLNDGKGYRIFYIEQFAFSNKGILNKKKIYIQEEL